MLEQKKWLGAQLDAETAEGLAAKLDSWLVVDLVHTLEVLLEVDLVHELEILWVALSANCLAMALDFLSVRVLELCLAKTSDSLLDFLSAIVLGSPQEIQ